MRPILIVEDETIMRESLRDWLADTGYQVETAEEGEEALKTIAEKDFGVVILDLRLPGKDGLEVLREAKEKRPQLKGIIITAYPSVQTAVEAMKIGAVDYLTKPFDLNDLEKSIREILGVVQVEIRPKAVPAEAVAEPVTIEKAKVEEVIPITAEEFPIHFRQGKAHFRASRYHEALKEFKTILAVAPGNIETCIWLRKTTKALATKAQVTVLPGAETALTEEARAKYCVWMKLGLVSYRLCTFDYDCLACEFDQGVRERMAAGESEVEEVLRRRLELPGSQRFCLYALKEEVSYRLCTRVFECAGCEFTQWMEHALEQKVALRQEAIQKKSQSWWWSYWG